MNTPLLIQFLLCPIVFVSLLKVTAPYGRHHQSGWGPNLPNRLAWLLMELPALLIISLLVMQSSAVASPQAWVPLGFWVVHYAYRSFIFPALMHPSDQTFPAMLVLLAFAFNSLNGYNNAEALIANGSRNAPLLSLHFVVGTLVFICGFILHVHSDHIIRNLRKPGEKIYRIPHGGHVSLGQQPALPRGNYPMDRLGYPDLVTGGRRLRPLHILQPGSACHLKPSLVPGAFSRVSHRAANSCSRPVLKSQVGFTHRLMQCTG
jgi:hypothetical protein